MKSSTLQALHMAFQQAEVRYIVVGGLAVVAHGYLRATQDADLVIELLPEKIERAFSALESLGYKPNVPVTAAAFADPENRRMWAEERNMTVLQFWSDRYRETPVDIFIEVPFDFEEEWDRAYLQELGSETTPLRFARIDTLIRMKQRAGRAQDKADIEQLLWIREKGGEHA